MNYFVQTLKAIKKPILLIFTVFTAIGILIWFKSQDTMPFWKPLCIMLLAALGFSVLLTALIAKALKKEAPLTEIAAEKGYCEEWLQKHSEIYPTPTRAEKLRRVDVLGYLGRYDEASELLDSISTFDMDDDRKFEYQNARLDLLLSTDHYQEAIAELDACRKFMDIYANMHPLRGAVYGCNAAVIRAVAGDYEDSEHFIAAAQKAISAEKSMSPIIVMIAKTMQLYALGFDKQAKEQEAAAKQEIETSPILAKSFQKERMMQLLTKAKDVAPENRQEFPQ